jgi:hypothetical protein
MLLRLGRWEEARAVFRRRLAVNADQWADWVGLLDATLQRMPDSAAASPAAAAAAAAAALPEVVAASDPEVKAAQTLALELQAAHPAYRGPYLAEMELLLRLAWAGQGAEEERPDLDATAPGMDESLGARLRQLVLAYLERFGTKLCCFDDLLPYVTTLAAGGDGQEGALVQQLERLAAETSVAGQADAALQAEEARPGVVRRLQMGIRVHQLLRLLRTGPSGGEPQNVERRKEAVAAWSAEYSRTLFVNEGAAGGQREVQQGDELVLLAAHALEDAAAAATTPKGALLARLEAAVLLEQGLRYSPHNYHFRLALLAAYDRLAAGEPFLEHYNRLEVKQIQLDTLSWLLYPACLRHGFYTEARVRSRNLLAMHAASAREAHDHVARALGYGTYAKALEIERFQRTRMDRSLQQALARCEAARLELLQRRHTPDEALTYLRELASGMLPESLAGEREEKMGLLPPLSSPSAAAAAAASSGGWSQLLSDNMDYLVVRDWRYRTRAQEEARRRAKGERHVLRVRLWIVLQGALLAGLQADAAQLRDRLPKVEALLQALGYTPSSSPPVNGHGCSTSSKDGLGAAPGARAHQGWVLALRSLEALAAVLEAVASPEAAAVVDPAVLALEAAAATVTATAGALLGEEPGRTLDRVLGGGSGLLDPDWLRSVSAFVAVAGAAACPSLLKLGAAVLQQPGGAGKKSKAKKGGGAAAAAAAAGAAGLPQPLLAAARGLLQGFGQLLAGLEGALKSFDRAGDSAEPAEALAARELGEQLWTFVGEADFADLQAHVVSTLRSSHRLSAARLREVLRAKSEALASQGLL